MHMKIILHYIIAILFFTGIAHRADAEEVIVGPFTVITTEGTKASSGDDKILAIEGYGEPTDWGIKLTCGIGSLEVTLKDLNIERKGIPLNILGSALSTIIIEGTNRFVSTGPAGTPGIYFENALDLKGTGSYSHRGKR